MDRTNSPNNPVFLPMTKTGQRLEDVYDRQQLSQMTEEDKKKLRAIIENGVEKPCPGLPGGDFCGKERADGGYCIDCRREYQRAKYRTKKLQQKAAEVEERVYKPTKTTQTNCNCCGTFNVDTLGVIEGISMPPICLRCHQFFTMLQELFPPKQILAILQFAMNTPQIVDRLAFSAEKHERIVKYLYERWFQEQQQMANDMRALMPPEKHHEITDPHPSEFRLNKDEYNRLALKWGYNEVFERPPFTFEAINWAPKQAH